VRLLDRRAPGFVPRPQFVTGLVKRLLGCANIFFLQFGTFQANGAVAEGGAFGAAGDDPNVLRMGVRLQA
jgi:hypothetical protein